MDKCIHAKCAEYIAIGRPCRAPEDHARAESEAAGLYLQGRHQEAARRLGYAGIDRANGCRPDPNGALSLVAGAREMGSAAGTYTLTMRVPAHWVTLIAITDETPFFSGDGYTVYYPQGRPTVWAWHNEGDAISLGLSGQQKLIPLEGSGYQIDWQRGAAQAVAQ